jgi:hypothetical protein
MKKIRIGSGAGYSGDRIEPAIELAEKGELDYLAFECLAERTIALAQQARIRDPQAGFDPLLEDRMRAVLPACHQNKVKIISNMGAANPRAAAEKTRDIARELGLTGLKIAYVLGDDVLDKVRDSDLTFMENGESVSTLNQQLISANAYLGVMPIIEALAAGADVVLTGRVADPALFLAPLIHEFGWGLDDWDLLGKGTLVGHLLECGGQVTGGYFADPGIKDVDDLARLGFPIAEVSSDGSAVITKVEGSGGKVTEATCKEQMIYEIHDPQAYYTPDVIADFSEVKITEIARNRVRVSGASGRPRSGTLKVSVGYRGGFIGEGQISYAGPGCVARGQLALEIVEKRLELAAVDYSELRKDLIGVNAIHNPPVHQEPDEVRIRVAARTRTMKQAVKIGNEVETLYTNGPAGGGGAVKSAKEIIAVLSVLLPCSAVHASVSYERV